MSAAKPSLAAEIDAVRRLVGDGRLDAAARQCAALEARVPNAPEVPVTQADIELRRGDGEAAYECARRAASRGARAVDVLSILAPAAIAVGAQQQVAECMQRFQQIPPERQPALLAYWSERLEDLFLFSQAASMLRPLAESPGADYDVLVQYAQLLLKSHQAEAATPVIERAIGMDADRTGALLARIRQFIQLGRIDEAADTAVAVLQRDPGAIAAVSMLSEIAPGRMPGAARALLERQLADADGDPERIAAAGLALGRWRETQDRDADAFSAFEVANRALKQMARQRGVDYDPDRVARDAEWLSRAFPSQQARETGPGEGLIFIVGMPRSGTTLLDRILAAHARVTSVGEYTAMPDIAARAGQFRCESGGFRQGVRDQADALRARYLSGLPYQPSGDRFIVDKLPLNFWNLGLIAVLFPAARIVHARRDPRDVALSSFRLRFPESFDYVNDFDDFAHYYAQQVRVMNHWAGVFPDWIEPVVYEHVVADLETSARRLLGSCGLEWDPACLEFSGRSEAVYTLSMGQVRRQLYRDASGRWMRYRQQLGGLERALDRYGVRPAGRGASAD